MTWLKGIVGVVFVLLGLVWIGQGTNILPGSFMSGQSMWAIIGLVLLIVGGWLTSLARARASVRSAHLIGCYLGAFGRSAIAMNASTAMAPATAANQTRHSKPKSQPSSKLGQWLQIGVIQFG